MEQLQVGIPKMAAVVDMALYGRQLPAPDGVDWVLLTQDGGEVHTRISEQAYRRVAAEWEDLRRRGQSAVVVVEGQLRWTRGQWWLTESQIRCRLL
jgi:hypothetical protein